MTMKRNLVTYEDMVTRNGCAVDVEKRPKSKTQDLRVRTHGIKDIDDGRVEGDYTL